MQAAWRAALSEVSHGISLGLVLAAGSRCPDCSPSLVCPDIHCPDCACAAPALLPACFGAFSLSDLVATGVCCAVLGTLLVLGLSRTGRVAAPAADATPGKVLSVRPRHGVWGASEGSTLLSDSGPRHAAASAA